MVVALLDSDCLVLALEINADGTIKYVTPIYAPDSVSVWVKRLCVVTDTVLML